MTQRIRCLSAPVFFTLLLHAAISHEAWAQPQYIIVTALGGGPPATPAAAVNSSFYDPLSVVVDQAGNVYFTAGNCVFKVDTKGVLTRLAGVSRSPSYTDDGGLAVSAYLGQAEGLAVDSAGGVYFAEYLNNLVRKLTASGTITTVAGTRAQGSAGDGGPAASAQLFNPQGIAFDAAGNLYIADSSNARIRKVSANGTITTVAGNGSAGYYGDGGQATKAELASPSGVAFDAAGNMYIADSGNDRVRKVTADGTITTVAGGGSVTGDGVPAIGSQLDGPTSIALDGAGNLYVAESGGNRIRKVATSGTITTVAGNGKYGYAGDGGPASSAELNGPWGVAVDAAGNVYIADSGNNCIRKVTADGNIATIAGNSNYGYAGDGGSISLAVFNQPSRVAVDSAGNVYIADCGNNRIRKAVAATGTISTVAGNGTAGYSGDGGLAINAQIASAGLYCTTGLAVDAGGNLYIADHDNNRVRKVTADGIITTVAGTGAPGFSGDGGPAVNAQLNRPAGVAVDAAGNLYIADAWNYRVRKVAADGAITTVAGNGTQGFSGDGGPATSQALSGPQSLAVDAAGNLYITDGNILRKLTTAGTMYWTQIASVKNLASAVVDKAGNVFVIDTDYNGIVEMMADGTNGTVAGGGRITGGISATGYTGDGGAATSARMGGPTGIAVDPGTGRLYIADTYNGVIRLLVQKATRAVLSIAKTHQGNFVAGTNGTYSLVVSNAPDAAATSGQVQVLEQLPSGFTLSSQGMAGTGWNCSQGGCTRSDSLGPGASYPPITVTMGVNAEAPYSTIVNQVSVSGGGSSLTIARDPTVIVGAAPAPTIGAGGIVNAASYKPAVAPGSIAAVFGTFLVNSTTSTSSTPWPTALGGLSVTFNGTQDATGDPGWLDLVSPSQVNLQVPWELAGRSNIVAMASLNGHLGGPQTVNLAPVAPGIFAINAQGTGQGAILDSTYRLVDASNPATAGSTYVLIYCTGLGPVTNQPYSGNPAPTAAGSLAWTTNIPTVTVGGASAPVSFWGLAPGYVGLYQVNAQVPVGSATGNAVPVTITIGGVVSNTVTIAVKAGG